MTVYGVITSALIRKFKALLAEIRTLVSEAKQKEQAILAVAESEAATAVLRDTLVSRIQTCNLTVLGHKPSGGRRCVHYSVHDDRSSTFTCRQVSTV